MIEQCLRGPDWHAVNLCCGGHTGSHHHCCVWQYAQSEPGLAVVSGWHWPHLWRLLAVGEQRLGAVALVPTVAVLGMLAPITIASCISWDAVPGW